MRSAICNFSEIAPVKNVLLHRPGEELLNLTPNSLNRLLFDEIPYMKVAQQEHDAFAKTLEDCGVEVLYLENVLLEAIESGKAREELTWEYLHEANIQSEQTERDVSAFLSSLTLEKLVQTMVS